MQRGVPREFARERLRAGIDQQLGRIESMSARRVVRAVYTIAIAQPGTAEPRRQETVPHVAGPRRQAEAGSLDVARGIEQAQLYAGGMRRINGEISAASAPVGAERLRLAGLERQHPGRSVLQFEEQRRERRQVESHVTRVSM
jgi:hypothetical protein